MIRSMVPQGTENIGGLKNKLFNKTEKTSVTDKTWGRTKRGNNSFKKRLKVSTETHTWATIYWICPAHQDCLTHKT